jgi:uncharacterized HAD superfamily protein
MNIALDIDGTISEHPEFFATLASGFRSAGHRILILTYRDPAREATTRAELARWGIVFDELVFAESLAAKGALCEQHAVDLFFDDQDECIVTVPERVIVCKLRNGGNFDYERQQWVSTTRLTHLLR